MDSENKSTSSWIVEDFAKLSQERDEALATIEALRRRVAELEGERDRWKSAHHEMVDRNKLLRDRPDLPIERLQAYKQITAENAELKRRVDALRKERKVSEALYDQLHTMSKTHAFRLCDDGSINAMDLDTDDWDILESGPAFDALKVYLEAAKGEVEG